MAGRFSQKTRIDLKETFDGQVEISYRCDADIAGGLGKFGEMIMRAESKTLEVEFAKALKKKLGNCG